MSSHGTVFNSTRPPREGRVPAPPPRSAAGMPPRRGRAAIADGARRHRGRRPPPAPPGPRARESRKGALAAPRFARCGARRLLRQKAAAWPVCCARVILPGARRRRLSTPHAAAPPKSLCKFENFLGTLAAGSFLPAQHDGGCRDWRRLQERKRRPREWKAARSPVCRARRKNMRGSRAADARGTRRGRVAARPLPEKRAAGPGRSSPLRPPARDDRPEARRIRGKIGRAAQVPGGTRQEVKGGGRHRAPRGGGARQDARRRPLPQGSRAGARRESRSAAPPRGGNGRIRGFGGRKTADWCRLRRTGGARCAAAGAGGAGRRACARHDGNRARGTVFGALPERGGRAFVGARWLDAESAPRFFRRLPARRGGAAPGRGDAAQIARRKRPHPGRRGIPARRVPSRGAARTRPGRIPPERVQAAAARATGPPGGGRGDQEVCGMPEDAPVRLGRRAVSVREARRKDFLAAPCLP